MDISNASLLDEGTAAAEAMIMLYNARLRIRVVKTETTSLLTATFFRRHTLSSKPVLKL